MLLAMRHGLLPGNLHFRELNQYIRLQDSPFYVVNEARPWERPRDARGDLLPRRAGISSFGFGGVNAHVVLEEYLDGRPDTEQRGLHLFVLSARTPSALRDQAQNLRRWLERHPTVSLTRLSFTLIAGREVYSERLATVAQSREELVRALDGWLEGAGPALHGSLPPGSAAEAVSEERLRALLERRDLFGLARPWTGGAAIDLTRLFSGPPPKRLSLPGYPFARDRYWIPVAAPNAAPADRPQGTTESLPAAPERSPHPSTVSRAGEPLERFFYLPRWRRIEPPPLAAQGTGQLWLVVTDPDDPIVALVAGMKYPSISVLPAALLSRPDASEHLRALPRPLRVMFVGAGAKATELASANLADQATARVVALFRLVRHLLALGLGRAPLDFTVCTFGVHAVLPGETIVPHDAGLQGLAGSLAREYSGGRVQVLDLTARTSDRPDAPPSAPEREALLRASLPGQWVLRSGAWHARVVEPIELPSAGTPFREGGAYLLLGGTGGLGLTLARELTSGFRARIALVGRRELDPQLSEVISALRASGGEVLYLRADASRPGSIRAAVDAARATFGELNGVVHSALDLCDETLERMDETTLRRALAPKVHGAVELADACAGLALDFFLFFSSGQSFSTDRGQANYAAACTFKDAFARSLGARGVPVRIVNWGYWGTVGAVADPQYRQRLQARGIGAIEPAEGLEAIRRVQAGKMIQVLAFKADERVLRQMDIEPDRRARRLPSAAPAADRLRINPPVLDPAHIERGRAASEALGRRTHALLVHALRRMRALPAPGSAVDPNATRAALGIHPAHHRLWAAYHHLLKRAGYLRASGAGLVVDPSIEALERTLEIENPAGGYPEIGAHLRLLETCMASCPEVLTGQRTATEVLFPGGSMSLVEGIYKGDRLTDHYNRLTAAAVVAAVQSRLERDPATRVRILEVGAGTGGTSASVLEALGPFAGSVEYLYTDLSAGFVRYGERTFGPAHSFAAFRVFDLEKAPGPQGLSAGSMDIVLAANVVHATRDIEQSLGRLKGLLRTGGQLMLLETTRPQDFATVTFGLTEGWWLFEDPRWRQPHTPLLSPTLWRQLLHQEGFEAFQALGIPGLAEDEQVQSVIIASSDGFIVEAGAGASASASAPGLAESPATPPIPAPGISAPRTSAPDAGALLQWLTERFGHVLKLDPGEIDPRATFEIYGVDSLVGMEVVRELERSLGALPSTLLFENPTLLRLRDTLLADFAPEVRRLFPASGAAPADTGPSIPDSIQAGPLPEPVAATRQESALAGFDEADIAVVGLSGRYPGAETLDEFWDNLRAGRESIGDLPESRFDWRRFYDPEPGREGRLYTARGGFIADADKFDPLFFNISPREAESMDPQERLFLEVAWAAMDDAGYPPSCLQQQGSRVGVFAGAMNNGYGSLGATAWARGVPTGARSAFWSIANRLSYICDFRGPSLCVDTACSASLTAIHLACESIRRGECDVAIAGGVNVIVHPVQLIGLCSLTMLSPTGRCHAFGAGADGFVDGEGAGAVLLKPLSRAVADGDHVWGVIRGSFLNAGGKTGGYTVPNPNEQAACVREALGRARVDPRTISYVEAHGTGTALGDPIEVAGLNRVFGAAEAPTRALGSVKANVGHLESAAGICGLTRILLQMRHGTLAPSLHCEPPNPRIPFAGSSFRVVREAEPWRRPLVDGKEAPRRAGLSSFGAGGANAHMVIEELRDPLVALAPPGVPPFLLVLSARDGERLHALARAFTRFLGDERRDMPIDPGRLCYTLQVGREPMAARLAVVGADLAALAQGLASFLTGETRPGVFRGHVKHDRSRLTALEAMPRPALVPGIHAAGLERWAELWVAGGEVPWNDLHPQSPPQRMSLPTYPFARESYWVDPRALEPEPATSAVVEPAL
ncbi:MAG TPA: SDR family NAD(P)-dependent oxidoreductase, partial [Candidatus Nanopelagicales bacterium]|nr:SDR family NAD(P)-dependent oxidoreductase [Candidatus Nanopelagicales bacterium]